MPGPGGRGGFGPRGFLTDEEKANLPKVDGKLIKRILSYLKPYRLQFSFVFIAILLSAVVGLLPSIINGVYKELYETQFRQVLDMEGGQDDVKKTDYWGIVEEDTIGF